MMSPTLPDPKGGGYDRGLPSSRGLKALFGVAVVATGVLLLAVSVSLLLGAVVAAAAGVTLVYAIVTGVRLLRVFWPASALVALGVAGLACLGVAVADAASARFDAVSVAGGARESVETTVSEWWDSVQRDLSSNSGQPNRFNFSSYRNSYLPLPSLWPNSNSFRPLLPQDRPAINPPLRLPTMPPIRPPAYNPPVYNPPIYNPPIQAPRVPPIYNPPVLNPPMPRIPPMPIFPRY